MFLFYRHALGQPNSPAPTLLAFAASRGLFTPLISAHAFLQNLTWFCMTFPSLPSTSCPNLSLLFAFCSHSSFTGALCYIFKPSDDFNVFQIIVSASCLSCSAQPLSCHTVIKFLIRALCWLLWRDSKISKKRSLPSTILKSRRGDTYNNT